MRMIVSVTLSSINIVLNLKFTLFYCSVNFFPLAMTKAFESKDIESAYKIDKLLNTGKNYKFLNDGLRFSFTCLHKSTSEFAHLFSEMIYYSNFLKLICLFEQIEDVMKEYERVTPHAYTPTFSVMEEILKAIELNEGYYYIPKIWGDLVLFNYSKRTVSWLFL